MNKKIVVVGLGEIGGAVLEDMAHRLGTKKPFVGVEVMANKVREWRSRGFRIELHPPKKADVFIIAVWKMEDIFQILDEIRSAKLIVIESTIDPASISELRQHRLGSKLATFPHRYNPADAEHRVFNLARVLGTFNPALVEKALDFYRQFMELDNIHVTTFENAVYCKVFENAYRFMEIVLAQEMAENCAGAALDWPAVRELMNTKWNIDVKQAISGVGGKCLPKDMALYRSLFPEDVLANLMVRLNEKFRSAHQERELPCDQELVYQSTEPSGV